MQVQEKNREKRPEQKIKVTLRINGQKFEAEGPEALMAKYTAKWFNKLKKPVTDIQNPPTQEEVIEFIEEQDKNDFRHSMPNLLNHFFGKGKRHHYQKVSDMAKKAREHISKRYNGQFRKEKMLPTDGKKTINPIIVWVFEPNTNKIS